VTTERQGVKAAVYFWVGSQTRLSISRVQRVTRTVYDIFLKVKNGGYSS